MKIKPLAAISTLFILSAITPVTQAAQGGELTGTYYLQGVREVGAELRLSANGRFSYGMAYGATDQTAKGTWKIAGERLELVADPGAEPRFVWGKSADIFEGDPDRPVDLVVRVSSPELGLVWRGMAVEVRYTNGQTRGGETGSSGLLAFEARTQGEWAGARPQAVGVSYPYRNVPQQWFDIPSGTKTAHITFAPGKLMPSAFGQLKLRIDETADKPRALIVVGDDGRDGWRFARFE